MGGWRGGRGGGRVPEAKDGRLGGPGRRGCPAAGLCDSPGRLLWKAPCLRGAPSALAARLPPEFRLSASPGCPLIHPRKNRVSAPFEPNQSIHVRKAAKVRS